MNKTNFNILTFFLIIFLLFTLSCDGFYGKSNIADMQKVKTRNSPYNNKEVIEEDLDKIREVVFRHMFTYKRELYGSKLKRLMEKKPLPKRMRQIYEEAANWFHSLKVQFIQVEGEKPPSKWLLERFKDISPPVLSVTELWSAPKIEKIDSSGRKIKYRPSPLDLSGLLYSIDKIELIGPKKAVVEASIILHGLGAQGYRCTLRFQQDVWVVLKFEQTWLS